MGEMKLRRRGFRWMDAIRELFLERILRTRLVQQTIAAALIGLLVFILPALPFGLARQGELGVRRILSEEFDFMLAAHETVSVLQGMRDGSTTVPIISGWLHRAGDNDLDRNDTEICLLMPVVGSISSPFGPRVGVDGQEEHHDGIDIMAKLGAPIRCAAAGTVVRVEQNDGYGLMVEVEHMEGVTTLYAHALEVFVQAGDSVVRGQVIARVGQTGRALVPHLHFELRRQGAAIDPLPFMDEHS